MSISSSSRERFLSVWPELSDELVAYLDKEGMPADAKAWFKAVRPVKVHFAHSSSRCALQNLDHNTPGGSSRDQSVRGTGPG